MKYKEGDKVKIKTWEELEKEFGLYKEEERSSTINLPGPFSFSSLAEKNLNERFLNRILTIEKISGIENENYYSMCNCGSFWTDSMIEYLVEEGMPDNPITSRFEILDL